MADKNISSIIENSIPRFVRQNYPTFVEFITVYYSQAEIAGQAYEFIANADDYFNIDTTTLDFLENFSKQFLGSIPKGILPEIDKRNLIKNIKQFYESAGTEASLKFIFRILFNEEIDIYYPTVDILRVSDGKWQDDHIIKVTNTLADETIVGLEGTEIRGETSGARALVERVKTYTSSNGFNVAEISMSEIDPVNGYHNFLADEYISGTTLDGEYSFRERILWLLTDINITTNGKYNQIGDLITISGTIGADAFIIVDSVRKGSINSMSIIEGGTGYAVGDLILFNSDSGRGARAVVSAIGAGDAITGITMVNNGYDYQTMPTYQIISSGGANARLYPVSTDIGKIESVKIINFGVGYDPNAATGFPFTFPIPFSFVVGSVSFYRPMFIYDHSWNSLEYQVNEIITGSVSNATGRIKKIDRLSGIISVDVTSAVPFQNNDIITGITSGATGYKIYTQFATAGESVSGSVGNYSGYFRNSDGFLSSDKYLQDSYYYQDFSYVLTTLRSREQWIGAVKDNVHPAGTIVFGFGEGEVIINDPSEGGWISPLLNSTEFYKFKWQPQQYGSGSISAFGNSQIETYLDFPIYKLAWIDPDIYGTGQIGGEDINILRQTNIVFGSQIDYDYGEQAFLIDLVNSLLIDNTNELIL